MSGLGADFGIVLAYLVPGFLAAWAAAYVVQPLGRLFRAVGESDKRAVALFALTAICLATGMFLSILRATSIDKSFELAVPKCATPQCGPVKRADPNFAVLACKGPRESFLLAEARDKRPYQFYGNIALALTIAAGVLLWRGYGGTSSRRAGIVRVVLTLTIWAVVTTTFYWSARVSHYRFMEAVTAINNTDCKLER